MNRYDDRIFFSPSLKLADMIERDVSLLNVLSRMGVSLGFGENTVAEVCARYGLDTGTFLLICSIYARPGYRPGGQDLESADIRDIVRYLHNSHSFYLDNDMRLLEESVARLAAPCDPALRKLIGGFMAVYREEVERHFRYEEQVVFPYVLSLADGKVPEDGYSISQFEENHSNIEEKLNDLKNIVMKYLPECCEPVLRNNVLYHLFSLGRDLDRHTFIEDEVLIPLAERRESHG